MAHSRISICKAKRNVLWNIILVLIGRVQKQRSTQKHDKKRNLAWHSRVDYYVSYLCQKILFQSIHIKLTLQLSHSMSQITVQVDDLLLHFVKECVFLKCLVYPMNFNVPECYADNKIMLHVLNNTYLTSVTTRF